ncbi:MAG: TrkA family potassium uptake protein [Bacteroidales bacterium]|nr:TrkA family potassium uptake protein [Bacteroidales bacterium]
MKYIIIGLGNFGSSLAQKLTNMGHEVIGVDSKMSKVDSLKEKITHTICLDSTDAQAVKHLPLEDTDVVMVCIGEDEGASILTTALMKQYKLKRLISRAVSPLHEMILDAMQVDEIVHPEEETAERWAKKLNISGVVDSFELSGDYNIIEAKVPSHFAGKTLGEIGVRRNYQVIVLTTIKTGVEKNLIGISKKVAKVQEIGNANTMLEENDIMVLYGRMSHIKAFLTEKG